jgi:hypothetical protein
VAVMPNAKGSDDTVGVSRLTLLLRQEKYIGAFIQKPCWRISRGGEWRISAATISYLS